MELGIIIRMFVKRRTARLFTATVGCVVLLSALAFAQSTAPFSAFMFVPGVAGEATDQSHQNWIAINSMSTDVGANLSNLVVIKPLDKSSPKLALLVSNGTPIKEIVIEFTRGTGAQRVSSRVVLHDLVAVSVRSAGTTPTGQPAEEVTFGFSEIKWSSFAL